jgi:ADP-ribose pyrophosphatase
MNPPSDGAAITTLSTREVYRNRWMRLREDRILRSNGEEGLYSVVEKSDAAIILPLDARPDGDDRIWLVEQFRYTIQEQALELPQGGWEMPGVDPEELARGELREETGIRAATMTYLGSTWIGYGFTRQKQHVFVATGLTHAEGSGRGRARHHRAQLAGGGIRAVDARWQGARRLYAGGLGAVSAVEGAGAALNSHVRK